MKRIIIALLLVISSINILIYAQNVFAAANETTEVLVNVVNSPPVVREVTVSPDPADPGNTLTVTANVTDVNSDIISVVGTFDYGTPDNTGDDVSVTLVFNPLSELYENNTFAVPFTAPAGLWAFNVTATDSFALQNKNSTTFIVNKLITIALANTPIDFGNASAGEFDRRADDGTPGSGYTGVTVKGFPLQIINGGNVNLNYSINSSNLIGSTDQSFNITVSNLSYNTAPNATTSTNMAYALQPISGDNAINSTEDVFFFLDIPLGTPEQSYRGNVTIVSQES